MRIRAELWQTRHHLVGLLVALAVLATACSGGDTVTPVPAPADDGVQPTTATTGASSSVETPSDEEVLALWEQTLDVFGAGPGDRAPLANELAERIPAQQVLDLTELHFVLGESVELTSNAVLPAVSTSTPPHRPTAPEPNIRWR